MSWSTDPEFAALFDAELRERLASLEAGLLELERSAGSPVSRDVLRPMQRDAHTVKGTARMAGAEAVVVLAHRLEDVLGAVGDGRVEVSPASVAAMLAAVSALVDLLPGALEPLAADAAEALVAGVGSALDEVLAGDVAPSASPRAAAPASPEGFPDDDADRAPSTIDPERTPGLGTADHGLRTPVVRVPVDRVHDLLDAVGDTDLALRRLVREVRTDPVDVDEEAALLREARAALLAASGPVPAAATDALASLATLLDRRGRRVRERRTRLEDAVTRLARVRAGAMTLATAPVSRVTHGLPRLVHDLAAEVGRDVVLEVVGADVELDVRVLDGVAEALRHLVTNAVDHGCEHPSERAAAGKPATATVTVAARAMGSTVELEVADDGRGVDVAAVRERAAAAGRLGADAPDERVLAVLLEPGFSTRDTVTSASGRGVGLDVVRTAVLALGGDVAVRSELGVGTRVVLSLPVTLGIARALVVRAAGERWAVPLTAVLETVPLGSSPEQEAAGVRVLSRRGSTVPVLDLAAAVAASGRGRPAVALVVRGTDGTTVAWAVDAVESEREMVVKELGPFLGHREAVLGATVDDEGRVVPLLDVRALVPVRLLPSAPAPSDGRAEQPPFPPSGRRPAAPAPATSAPAPHALARGGRPRVLVVEDSVGVRELARSVLEGAGFAVSTAVDGLDGAARLGLAPVDLVVTDVEMPGMDGFTLTRTLRATRGWEHVPVVVLTSRGSSADREAGLAAGADAYLLKSEFSPRTLVDTVHDLLAAHRAPLAIEPVPAHPTAPSTPPHASSGSSP